MSLTVTRNFCFENRWHRKKNPCKYWWYYS